MAKFKPYKINPIEEFSLDIPRAKRREALEAAGEYLKQALLDYIADARSPVSGGKWVRSLSKEYKEKKLEESGVGFANLELSGDLLDSLSIDANSRSITIDVGRDQYGKAEGNISGEYGANAKKIKPRQFLPQGSEKFKRDILRNLKDILKEYEDGE